MVGGGSDERLTVSFEVYNGLFSIVFFVSEYDDRLWCCSGFDSG